MVNGVVMAGDGVARQWQWYGSGFTRKRKRAHDLTWRAIINIVMAFY